MKIPSEKFVQESSRIKNMLKEKQVRLLKKQEETLKKLSNSKRSQEKNTKTWRTRKFF